MIKHATFVGRASASGHATTGPLASRSADRSLSKLWFSGGDSDGWTDEHKTGPTNDIGVIVQFGPHVRYVFDYLLSQSLEIFME